jgi:hypothetical protein
MKKRKSKINKNTDNFELNLFRSLKSYGYIFPASIKDVEKFEELYGNTDINAPSHFKFPEETKIEDIIGVDFNTFQNIAAYGNSDILPFNGFHDDLSKIEELDKKNEGKKTDEK